MKTKFICFLLSAVLFIITGTNISAQIIINEYSASNLLDFPDNYSKFEDWIEIYNSGPTSVVLESYSLSDSPDNPGKWVIPSGISIAAGQFIRFWTSGRDEVSGSHYHTNFKLTQTKNNAEYIVLSDPSGIITDQIQLEKTQLGHSRGRTTNGADEWSIFTNPTPGSSNNSASPYLRYSEGSVMSVPAGFYAGSITVALSTDELNAEIRYTTNGDLPTNSSALYTSPLTVSSTTIIKACVFSNDPDILSSFIEFNTYFIDVNHSLAVISVSSNTLDELLNGNQSLKPFGTAEYFDLNGIRTTDGYGEFNEHGQDSWVHDQRSIDYITRDECGYNYALQEKLLSLSDRDEFQRIIIRASGDDNYPGIDSSAHMRDMYIQKLANMNNMNLDVRKAERCIMYVNGIYWGIYSIREKVNDHDFTKFYYNQGKYDLQFLMLWGSTWAEYGGAQAFQDWNTLHSYILNNDMSIQENYENVVSQYDVTSLVDYVLINSYVVCSDWLNWNVGWWRGLNPDGGHKKWGYILWDEDATFGHYYNYTGVPAQTPYVSPCFPEGITSNWQDPEGHIAVLNQLRDNAEFDQYYISRYADLLNTALREDSMINLLDSIELLLQAEMPGHLSRWGGNFSQWQTNVEKIRNFISIRRSIVDDGLIDCYSLNGPFQLSFNVEPTGAGDIQVNSVLLDDYIWEGSYFGGIDIILKAHDSNPEYEFESWSLNNHTVYPSANSNEVSLNITADDNITAHFVPRTTFDSLVINEINYNSALDFNPGDWIELYNPHDYELDITNWIFKDEDDLHTYIFPSGTSIEARSYLVLCQDTTAFHGLFPDVNNYIGQTGFGLSGNGELLRLYDSSGLLVDTVHYDDNAPWPEGPDGNGPTLELINPLLDNAIAGNWTNCEAHGTPGDHNCTYVDIDDQEIINMISLSIFPNPVSSHAFIVINTDQEFNDLKIEIYNSLGIQVKTISNIKGKQVTFSRENLSNGFYICKLVNSENRILETAKIILQ